MTGFASSHDVLQVPNEDSRSGTKLGKFRQFFAASVVTLGIFGLGTVLAYTSPALPKIESTGDLGNVTYSQKAWVGSTSMLGALSSSPFAGYGVDKFGRKNLMILLAFPFIAGWIFIPISTTFTLVYIGRFITGFCAGGLSLAVPIFISEMAEDHIRGLLSSLFQLMMVLGILFIYVVGTYVTWQNLAYISAAFPTLFLILLTSIPESPRYLLAKGRRSDATKSLVWFRGVNDPDIVESEISRVQASIDESKGEKVRLATIFSRSIIQPVLICLSLMVFEQISGFNAIIFYTVDIFKASGSQLDSNLATIIIGIVQVLATVVSCILVDLTGRRILLIFSEVVMAASLFILGAFFYIKTKNKEVSPEGFGWVPITSLIVFIIAFAQGIGPLSWTIMGEILPPNLKGPCSSVATFLVWFSAFLVTLGYEHLLELLGRYWCFWLFAIFCVIGTVVVTLFVPETKGRSLEEIQSLFNHSDKKKPLPASKECLAGQDE
ncbi:unnamed protein product [Allacma fusca]|uniref:Major facilitator superfamily (MFS) profile domain-containing protein n=1 Tax=Allacma fusca TaxID=39272 RepID=A0A8J2NQF5_9HEXA|nr:unnamed protein product [Allacma fusca]